MTEEEWRRKFAERIMERTGYGAEHAKEIADVVDYYPDWTPEDSADEEISYWTD